MPQNSNEATDFRTHPSRGILFFDHSIDMDNSWWAKKKLFDQQWFCFDKYIQLTDCLNNSISDNVLWKYDRRQVYNKAKQALWWNGDKSNNY